MGTGPRISHAGLRLLTARRGLPRRRRHAGGRLLLDASPCGREQPEQYGVAPGFRGAPGSGSSRRRPSRPAAAQLTIRWRRLRSGASPAGTARGVPKPASARPLLQTTDMSEPHASAGAGTAASAPGFRRWPAAASGQARDRYRNAHPQVRDVVGPVRHVGCVGCGRCITWCPVGIDVRDELNAIAPPVPLSPESRLVGRCADAQRFRHCRVRQHEGGDGRHDHAHAHRVDPAFSHGSTGQFAMVALRASRPPDLDQPLCPWLTIRGAGPATKACAPCSS